MGFTATGQIVQSIAVLKSHKNEPFKRLYLGWASWDAGDLVVEGILRFRLQGTVQHQERFIWAAGPSTAGLNFNSAELFVPPFSVNKIPYVAGVSNVQPVSANVGPDARIWSLHYTDNAAASFAAQVSCQPTRFPIQADELEIEINATSGTIAGTGFLFIFSKLDSSALPL